MRPLSVAIISWIIIVCNAFGFIAMLLLMVGFAGIAVNGMAIPKSLLLIGFIVYLVMIILGWCMFKGANWARIVFTVIAALACVLPLYSLRHESIPDAIGALIFLFIFVFFFYSDKANTFFASSAKDDVVQ